MRNSKPMLKPTLPLNQLVISLGLSFLVSATYAQEVQTQSHIDTVTVYRDSAQIQRSGQVQLQSGEQTLLFQNLPSSLLNDSVRLNIQTANAADSDSSVTIVDIKTVDSINGASQQQAVQEISHQLFELDRQIAHHANQVKVLSNQVDFYNALPLALIKESATKPSMEAIKQDSRFSREQQTQLLDEQLSIIQDQEKLKKERDLLEQKRKQLVGNAEQFQHKDIQVRLQVKKSQPAQFQLSYGLPNASWQAEYKLHYDENETGKVQLEYGAHIQQNTGEDWDKVRVILSTDQANMQTQIPQLTPWRLSLLSPEENRLQASTRMTADAPVGVPVSSSPAMFIKQARRAEVSAQPELTRTKFEIKTPISLKNQQKNDWISISQKSIQMKQSFAWYPDFSNQVLLSLDLKNEFDFPILPGKIKTYTNDQFIGETWLPLILSQGKFDLSLGQVQKLIVHRDTVRKLEQDTGVFNKVKEVNYEINQTLENNMSKPADLMVYYRFPVSENEQIKVQIVKPDNLEPYDPEMVLSSQTGELTNTPKNANNATSQFSPKGFYKQTVALKQGEKINLPVHFKISYPPKESIKGLP